MVLNELIEEFKIMMSLGKGDVVAEELCKQGLPGNVTVSAVVSAVRNERSDFSRHCYSYSGVRGLVVRELLWNVSRPLCVSEALVRLKTMEGKRLFSAIQDILDSWDEANEEKAELRAQIEAGELDIGADSDAGSDDRLEFSSGTKSYGCFAKVAVDLGAQVDEYVRSVDKLSDRDRCYLSELTDRTVHVLVYGHDDCRNHVELLSDETTTDVGHSDYLSYTPVPGDVKLNLVMSVGTFYGFNYRDEYWQTCKYYADKAHSGDEFGNDAHGGSIAPVHSLRDGTTSYDEPAPRGVVNDSSSFRGNVSFSNVGAPGAQAPGARANVPTGVPAPESVSDAGYAPGSANVNGGVARARRRVISSKSYGAMSAPVNKNYRTVGAVMFNNTDEMYQDTISRDYAQEIIEQLFDTWGVPRDQPEAMKYAEDLLFSFMITTTASNKADYNRSFQIPVRPVHRNGELVEEVDANFITLSAIIESGHGKTRRQFSRAIADDMRSFLKMSENSFMLPQLATRVGCESLLAYLAFDGSTHCTNMTTREVSFTKTLESRNLFERDDVIASGASDRLMSGFSGGVRSVAPR